MGPLGYYGHLMFRSSSAKAFTVKSSGYCLRTKRHLYEIRGCEYELHKSLCLLFLDVCIEIVTVKHQSVLSLFCLLKFGFMCFCLYFATCFSIFFLAGV